MKATEIISALQSLVDKHGDKEVIDVEGYEPVDFEYDEDEDIISFDIQQ